MQSRVAGRAERRGTYQAEGTVRTRIQRWRTAPIDRVRTARSYSQSWSLTGRPASPQYARSQRLHMGILPASRMNERQRLTSGPFQISLIDCVLTLPIGRVWQRV